jgi:hypothetical protein
VHEASGNTFETITDARGVYRLPARSGVYVITAQLTGFVTVTRRGVELLVGQTAAINLQMAVGAAEAVTVTAETPLVNTVTSNLGGNVDPRQVQELPVASAIGWASRCCRQPHEFDERNAPRGRHGGDAGEFS